MYDTKTQMSQGREGIAWTKGKWGDCKDRRLLMMTIDDDVSPTRISLSYFPIPLSLESLPSWYLTLFTANPATRMRKFTAHALSTQPRTPLSIPYANQPILLPYLSSQSPATHPINPVPFHRNAESCRPPSPSSLMMS